MLGDNLRRTFEDRFLDPVTHGYKDSVILFSGEFLRAYGFKKKISKRHPSGSYFSRFQFHCDGFEACRAGKGALLFEPDCAQGNTYFPLTPVISFTGDTGEGGSVEVWAVGSEGAAGVSGIIGRTKPGMVQVPGTALASKSAVLRKHFERCWVPQSHVKVSGLPDDPDLLSRNLHNRHSIEQRFSRWLLMIEDRARSIDLRFTQDAIAGVLGTRRATISVAAAALQNGGLIRYTPGSITILSRKALERATWGCYKAISSFCC